VTPHLHRELKAICRSVIDLTRVVPIAGKNLSRSPCSALCRQSACTAPSGIDVVRRATELAFITPIRTWRTPAGVDRTPGSSSLADTPAARRREAIIWRAPFRAMFNGADAVSAWTPRAIDVIMPRRGVGRR
jgi:hypothetical protein